MIGKEWIDNPLGTLSSDVSKRYLAPHRTGKTMTDPITVLVVEDEPLVRMDISDQLQDFGFKVLEAANADEAVKMLVANADIEIMFTDVDMPGGMDGLKLAAAVRDRWPPIKIIVTSGHRKVSMDDIPVDSRFFGKPYRADAVAAAIREMVG